MDEFPFEDDDHNHGVISRCQKCGCELFDVIKRDRGEVEDDYCELEELHKCRECGKVYKQSWFSQHWEDAEEEEKESRVIILENGAEIVIGGKKKEEEGVPDPEDWVT
jgi:uncharacterized protein with PIN domain